MSSDSTGDRSDSEFALRGFPEFLASAWRFYRDTFGRLVLSFGALLVPIGIIRALFGISVVDPANPTSGEVLASLLGSIAFIVAASVLVGSAAETISRSLVQDEAGPRRLVAGRLRDVFSASLLAAMISLLAFVLPLFGLFFAMFLGPPVLMHAVVIEGLSFGAASRRARELLGGAWGRALLYLLVITMVVELIQVLAVGGAAVGLRAAGLTSDGYRLSVGVVSAAINSLALPFLAAAMTSIYFDLRATKEGFDRAALAQDIERG